MTSQLKNHCDRIFHGLYIQRNVNESVKIAPCCISTQSESKAVPIDFVNDEYLNRLRQNTLQDQRNIECETCWKYEDNNQFSKRHEKFSKVDDSSIILSLEYNTLPICNAKCIICGPNFSSAWIQDDLKLNNSTRSLSDINIKKIVNNGFNYDTLNLTQLEYLYFNGGEPLLTSDHLNVLSKIENIENLTLSYNTNGSVYPSSEVLDYWNKAKLTRIWFSIDAINDQFNYIRFPLDWKQVRSNIINLYNNFPKIEIGILFTLGVHNVFEVKKTLDFFYKDLIQISPDSEKADRYQFFVQLANGRLDLQLASSQLKQTFINELTSIDQVYQNKTNYVINYLESQVTPKNNDWQDYLDRLDAIRNTNWRKTFPNLSLT